MTFLLILVLATLAVAGHARIQFGAVRWRHAAQYGLGIAFVVAGVSHLVNTTPFEQHLPEWVPAATAIVVVSGIAEIVLGFALVAARRSAPVVGIAAAVFLVSVFPANVYVAVAGVDVDGLPGGFYRVAPPTPPSGVRRVGLGEHAPDSRPCRDGPRQTVRLDAGPPPTPRSRPRPDRRSDDRPSVGAPTAQVSRRACVHVSRTAASERFRRFPRRDRDVTPRRAATSHVLDAVTLAFRRRSAWLCRSSRPPRRDAPLPTRHAIIELHHVAHHRRSPTHLERRRATPHYRWPADRRSPGGTANLNVTSSPLDARRGQPVGRPSAPRREEDQRSRTDWWKARAIAPRNPRQQASRTGSGLCGSTDHRNQVVRPEAATWSGCATETEGEAAR